MGKRAILALVTAVLAVGPLRAASKYASRNDLHFDDNFQVLDDSDILDSAGFYDENAVGGGMGSSLLGREFSLFGQSTETEQEEDYDFEKDNSGPFVNHEERFVSDEVTDEEGWEEGEWEDDELSVAGSSLRSDDNELTEEVHVGNHADSSSASDSEEEEDQEVDMFVSGQAFLQSDRFPAAGTEDGDIGSNDVAHFEGKEAYGDTVESEGEDFGYEGDVDVAGLAFVSTPTNPHSASEGEKMDVEDRAGFADLKYAAAPSGGKVRDERPEVARQAFVTTEKGAGSQDSENSLPKENRNAEANRFVSLEGDDDGSHADTTGTDAGSHAEKLRHLRADANSEGVWNDDIAGETPNGADLEHLRNSERLSVRTDYSVGDVLRPIVEEHEEQEDDEDDGDHDIHDDAEVGMEGEWSAHDEVEDDYMDFETGEENEGDSTGDDIVEDFELEPEGKLDVTASNGNQEILHEGDEDSHAENADEEETSSSLHVEGLHVAMKVSNGKGDAVKTRQSHANIAFGVSNAVKARDVAESERHRAEKNGVGSVGIGERTSTADIKEDDLEYDQFGEEDYNLDEFEWSSRESSREAGMDKNTNADEMNSGSDVSIQGQSVLSQDEEVYDPYLVEVDRLDLGSERVPHDPLTLTGQSVHVPDDDGTDIDKGSESLVSEDSAALAGKMYRQKIARAVRMLQDSMDAFEI